MAETFAGLEVQRNVPMRAYTTLKAGGAAERFVIARSTDQLAAVAEEAHRTGTPLLVLGWGSNMLPADEGVSGLVALNLATRLVVARTGEILADTGCMFQDVWLKSAQAGLTGLEFAVGIPGTLGGALVSNAGAYRSCISDHLEALEVVWNGERKWIEPQEMGFSYRDSILRSITPPKLVVLRVRLKLQPGNSKESYDLAREFQRQRIGKQPPQASAGSFFKNVNDRELAESLPGLPWALKEAGVVPAGFLIEAAGLKGYRFGGAAQGEKHANFVLNLGAAPASELRALAQHTKAIVQEKFGVELEEEVLYVGKWPKPA